MYCGCEFVYFWFLYMKGSAICGCWADGHVAFILSKTIKCDQSYIDVFISVLRSHVPVCAHVIVLVNVWCRRLKINVNNVTVYRKVNLFDSLIVFFDSFSLIAFVSVRPPNPTDRRLAIDATAVWIAIWLICHMRSFSLLELVLLKKVEN